MKKGNNSNKKKKKKIIENLSEKKELIEINRFKKKEKKFTKYFIIWILFCCIFLVKKALQNDTLYTIKIGELILNNGIDMMDHFSWHSGLVYTYPHWLYDVMIYLIYKIAGFTSLYISSILFMMVLILIVFKTNLNICKRSLVAGFATFICALAIGGFVTARAQLISFILFALQINFIENYLDNKNKKYLFGLLGISLLICNMHVAVWPFYFIVYLPYLVEYGIAKLFKKIKVKKENKFIKYIKSRFILEENDNIKMIFLIMVLSLLTGLITPIGDTPYTYLIKTMMGNSQNYILEHQALTWKDSPFTIIIAGETLFLGFFHKIKLRDLFMICGLVLMSVVSVRHISLLALIGTICFSRVFEMFLENVGHEFNYKVLSFFTKTSTIVIIYIITIIGGSVIFCYQTKANYLDEEFYPIKAVNYLKENVDMENMKLYNDYNFGSYLLYNDIPVFIDSRADLYTKQFSGFDYDIFDDYESMAHHYQSKFEFYGITHALLYKEKNALCDKLLIDDNYKVLFEDKYFVLFEKIGTPGLIIDEVSDFELTIK